MAGMKQIQAAQVVLLRTAGAEADRAVQDLRDLGMSHVSVVASALDLAARIAGGKVDIIVVHDEELPAHFSRSEQGLARPPTDALSTSIPCLLLTASPAAISNHAAQAAGFAAVLGDTVPARVLYRRVGALLQRVRRLGRERDAARRAAA